MTEKINWDEVTLSPIEEGKTPSDLELESMNTTSPEDVMLTEEQQNINTSRADYETSLAKDIEVAGIGGGDWTEENSMRSDARQENVRRAREAAAAERAAEDVSPSNGESNFDSGPTDGMESRGIAVEKSEYEQFKKDVSEKTSALVGRAGDLFSRVGGAIKEGGWKALFGAKKGAEKIGEGIDATVEFGERGVVAGKEFVESGIAAAGEARDAVVEKAIQGKEAIVAGGRAVVSGAESAATFTIGAGILAAEKVGQGINATVELGERGIAAGKEFVEAGIARAEMAKEAARENIINAKNATTEAVSRTAMAAKEKTLETVNAGKEAIQNGVMRVAEAGVAVKNKATEGVKSAWEGAKEKGNMIKRGIIMAKLAFIEAQHQRISEKAQAKLTQANALRAALASL